MARLRLTRVQDQFVVAISGRFSSNDLGRLERLCGPALEHPRLTLTLQFVAGSEMDPSVQAFLDRLIERGATVSQP